MVNSIKSYSLALLGCIGLHSNQVSSTPHETNTKLVRRREKTMSWVIDTTHGFSYQKQAPDGPDHWYSVNTQQKSRWITTPATDHFNHCNTLPMESPINVVANADCQRFRTMEPYTPQWMESCTMNDFLFEITPFGLRTSLITSYKCVPPTIVLPTGVHAVDWSLTGIQLKMQSEHTLEGIQYDGELVLTHSHDTQGFMHISIMIEASSLTKDERIEALISRWEQTARKSRIKCNKEIAELTLPTLDYPLNQSFPYDMITSQSFFEYEGTLTEPPCTPNVNWILLETPLKITKGQYKRLATLMENRLDPYTCKERDTALADTGENVRPIQKGGLKVAYCA